MRLSIVAGNWKMNKNAAETRQLIHEIIDLLPSEVKAQIIIAPPFVNLMSAVQEVGESNIAVAAQNMHQAENGAFTGEISASMLTNIGVGHVILGHSERRAFFGETDQKLAEKVNTALQHSLQIIFCFGEELADRKANSHFDVVASQLQNGLFHIEAAHWEYVILAYEPVWAIGTGETASPEQAQEMHQFIRQLVAKTYGEDIANQVSILYGGSVKPDNAAEIFAKPDVDGGLIGGASLKATDFVDIVRGVQ
jgi:triosephosphate isomerase